MWDYPFTEEEKARVEKYKKTFEPNNIHIPVYRILPRRSLERPGIWVQPYPRRTPQKHEKYVRKQEIKYNQLLRKLDTYPDLFASYHTSLAYIKLMWATYADQLQFRYNLDNRYYGIIKKRENERKRQETEKEEIADQIENSDNQ